MAQTYRSTSSNIPDQHHLQSGMGLHPPTVEEIYAMVWRLSMNRRSHEAMGKLRALTMELIRIYEMEGRLTVDPFETARQRKFSLEVNSLAALKNSTCIVTGGLGCVGSMLVNELVRHGVRTVVILDLNTVAERTVGPSKIVSVFCDVRNAGRVGEIFSVYKPDYVFHTAAQRDPGLAETQVLNTVTTNVLGTFNVVKACEATLSVKQMVYTSTGKASRYFTQEVYAATKKMTEFLLSTYAEQGRIKYSLVRFTHILDNSLMNIALEKESREGDFVSVHSPGKYVTAQNAMEAVTLMINAIAYAEKAICNLLLVRHLEWPVESLEMALYYIRQSQRSIPVIFVGNPRGYSEKFFRGQLDWSNPEELNLLTNVYERRYRRLNTDGDIIITRACSCSKWILDKTMDQIERAGNENTAMEVLINGLAEMVRDSLKNVAKEDTVAILKWGLEPQYPELEKLNVSGFSPMVALLAESLAGSDYGHETDEEVYQFV